MPNFRNHKTEKKEKKKKKENPRVWSSCVSNILHLKNLWIHSHLAH